AFLTVPAAAYAAGAHGPVLTVMGHSPFWVWGVSVFVIGWIIVAVSRGRSKFNRSQWARFGFASSSALFGLVILFSFTQSSFSFTIHAVGTLAATLFSGIGAWQFHRIPRTPDRLLSRKGKPLVIVITV